MNKDILNLIWNDQKKFNSKLVDVDNITEAERQHWLNFYALAMYREVGEFVDETNWKVHRKNTKTPIMSNMLEEWVDIFKYWLCMGQLYGFTAEDFTTEYFRKSEVVEQRYQQEIVQKYDGKIVGVDIDGILADYPKSFVEFINERGAEFVPRLREVFSRGEFFNLATVTSYDIYADLGISPEEGAILKDAYRQTGYKRFIPVIEGAKTFLNNLKMMGFTVVLLTSRPYEQYKRIFADTKFWLDNNELVYDCILWDSNKGQRLVDEFGRDKIEFFIDDVVEFANGVSDMGMPCFLMNKTYNVGEEIGENVIRVNNLNEALQLYMGGTLDTLKGRE